MYKMDETTRQLKQLQEQLDSIKSSSQSQTRSLEEELKKSEDLINVLKNRIEVSDLKVRGVSETLNKTREQLNISSTDLNSCKNETSEKQKEISDCLSQTKSLKDKVDEYDVKYRTTEEKLKLSEEKLYQAEKDKKLFEQKTNNQVLEISELKNKLKEKIIESDTLKYKLDSTIKEKEDIAQENFIIKERYRCDDEECSVLSSNIDILRSKQESLTNKYNEAQVVISKADDIMKSKVESDIRYSLAKQLEENYRRGRVLVIISLVISIIIFFFMLGLTSASIIQLWNIYRDESNTERDRKLWVEWISTGILILLLGLSITIVVLLGIALARIQKRKNNLKN